MRMRGWWHISYKKQDLGAKFENVNSSREVPEPSNAAHKCGTSVSRWPQHFIKALWILGVHQELGKLAETKAVSLQLGQ